jgi:hypothetical protein
VAIGIFKYLDSLGVVHTQSFDILSVKGNSPDSVRFVPPLLNNAVDGSTETQYKGFQRKFRYELKAINLNEDYLRSFLQASAKSITYQDFGFVTQESQVVFEEDNYENEWIDGFEHDKKYVIELIESTVRTVFPERWIDNNPTDSMIGYTKIKVKIEGTQASPELFTTNLGKLAITTVGSLYPVISLLSYVVVIIANGSPYQDRKINQVGDIVQSGGNISFFLALSDTGADSSDTYSYADITILLQPIL